MGDFVYKKCKKHGLTKFSFRKSEKRYRCKKCNIERVTERRRKLKRMLVEYKGGKCVICGYNRCMRSLQFHHLDPKEKDFAISTKSNRGLKKLIKEADKYILVCSRCHDEIHEDLIDLKGIKENNDNNVFKNVFKKEVKVYNCKKCGIEITKYSKLQLCLNCYSIKNRKIKDRPPFENLIEDIKNMGYCGTGRKYGVSDNAIRKWIKKYKKEREFSSVRSERQAVNLEVESLNLSAPAN